MSILVFIVALLFALGYVIYSLSIFKVSEQNIISNITLKKSLKSKIVGNSLFAVDINSISSQILRENPEYKNIYVSRRFPSSLVVEGYKRRVFAQIKGKMFYPVDREAVILSEGSLGPLTGFIPIEIDQRSGFFKKGYKIRDKSINQAFKLIEALQSQDFLKNFAVTLINSTEPEAIYFFIKPKILKDHNQQLAVEDVKVIISQDNLKQKVILLKNLLVKEIEDLSLVKYIDLRYKKVYVGFKR